MTVTVHIEDRSYPGLARFSERGRLERSSKGWVLHTGDGSRVFPLRDRDVDVYSDESDEPIIVTRGMDILVEPASSSS